MIARLKSLWLIAVPIAVAVGYGVFELIRLSGETVNLLTSDVLVTLATEPRIQVFVVLPSWLIACCAAITRSHAARNLIRSGSWVRATHRSWPPLFILFFISSVVVVVLWLGIAVTGSRADADVLLALGICGASIIWTAVSLGSVFLVLSIVALLSSSRAAMIAVALAIWIWAGLSNLGFFIGTNLDASYYFSIGFASTRPLVMIISIAVLTVLGALAWLVANERDQAHKKGFQKLEYGSVAGLLAATLVFLESATSDSDQLSVASVFSGLDGSVAHYLYGMLPILLIVSIGTSRFSEDWHHRLPSLAMRYGSYPRLVWRSLAIQFLSLIPLVGGLLAVAVAGRLATRGATVSWFAETSGGLSAFPRIFLACLLFMAIGTLSVVVFSSEIAWAAASGLLLALGSLPLNAIPGFPITGWATMWTGTNANIAGLILTLSAVGAMTATMIVAGHTKGATSHARY